MVTASIPMREGKELVGENGQRYLLVQAMGQPNVWIAVDAATQEKLYLVKQPGEDDAPPNWPRFQHEMVMHEMFKDHDAIRPQLDRIPPTSRADPPKLVLELLQMTLWDARRRREFSHAELKQVMRQILVGLKEVHDNGLVYADLKMENILLSGFEPNVHDSSTSTRRPNITAKLGDLGIVMAPIQGTVQPISYRAPEVYFRHEISPAADIWAWGLIYCHLLEAKASFHQSGLYDNDNDNDGDDDGNLLHNDTSFVGKELGVRKALAADFALHRVPYYDACALPYLGAGAREGTHWDTLRRKGVCAPELDFLKWVLHPVPTQRPGAQQILDAGWLEEEEEPMQGDQREGCTVACGVAAAAAVATSTCTTPTPTPTTMYIRSIRNSGCRFCCATYASFSPSFAFTLTSPAGFPQVE